MRQDCPCDWRCMSAKMLSYHIVLYFGVATVYLNRIMYFGVTTVYLD